MTIHDNLRRGAAAFSLGAVTLLLTFHGLAAPATAQLSAQRLSLLPARVTTGPGTVRLTAMGGFEAAVRDENYQLNLWDFSSNPAGFGDDRDAWSLELRYGHDEYAERDPGLRGNDFRINDGSFLGGYHAPGRLGVGARVDYAQVEGQDFAKIRDAFDILGFGFQVNKYLFPSLTAGVSFSRTSESTDFQSRSIYTIDHENTYTRGGLGLGWTPVAGVMIGGRGELISGSLEGTSTGSFHTDRFTWDQPGGLVSVHGFINRGRLELGADYSRTEIQGEESVRISWSERFIFNPSRENISKTLDTFTEDRVTDALKVRGSVHVVPGRLSVSGALFDTSEDFTVVTNPNAIGSELPRDVTTQVSALVAGSALIVMDNRMLLAGELKLGQSEVSDRTIPETAYTNKIDETTLRLGGEYFLSEAFTARAGLVFLSQDYKLETDPDFNDTYSTTRVTAGFGVLPSGAIWQFDLALDVDLSSDLDTRQTGFSGYVKYLF